MADTAALQFIENLLERVDKQVRATVLSMLKPPAVGAQDDGEVVANYWNILNFQGDGVSVTEDANRRRVNVYVPGAPVATGDSNFYSSTSVKTMTLWGGASGSVSISYVAAGGEGGNTFLGSTALPAFTGAFTTTITESPASSNILNFRVHFIRSTDSSYCHSNPMSLGASTSSVTDPETVGVGSWPCTNWDTLSWNLWSFTDPLVAGTTYTV